MNRSLTLSVIREIFVMQLVLKMNETIHPYMFSVIKYPHTFWSECVDSVVLFHLEALES